VLAAAKPVLTPAILRVLLVGTKEEDFFLIREIMERNQRSLPTELDHAHSLEEAKTMLQQDAYGLVLFERDADDAEAVRLLAEFLQVGISLPFILLTEDADEKTVAEIIEAGTWNCLTRSQLDGATLIRTIRSTLELHSVRQDQQAAEESLRKLSRAVEQSADAIMVTNRSGIIEYVNPAFEAVTGFTAAEACGKTPEILKSGEQGPEFYQELWNTLQSGNIFRGILVNRKRNGELYYVEENISPVRDADGRITHFISNGRDLTDRIRLEAQLLQAQKMDAVGRLAGGVAHDFNNLLTIITSYSELAMDDVPQPSPLEAKLKEILMAARRAAELTRQLLAFSRKQPQALRVADLNKVIADIAKTLPRLIGEDIEFAFVPGSGLCPVRVDPVQIEQILMNLAANARDAMPEGGHLRIETSDVMLDEKYVDHKNAMIPLGRYALITVSDDGPGIPAEHLPHIFEPFFTTKPLGEGTGLGLATVYGIVKQNRGFVWVYSEPQMGTVFKVYLPGVPVQHRTDDAETPKTEIAARGAETILLVEDELAVRRATSEFLRLQGYTVLEAKDGLEALDVARNHGSAIHLVVTDVVMPNMSGGQLATELNTMRPETLLLFVSGYAGKTVLDHKVFDLETNFLQKPYTLKQLSGKIRAALDQVDQESDQKLDQNKKSAVSTPRIITGLPESGLSPAIRSLT
jgi:two-component system, cell cycle sensor histidine kinase and response regulator CckA